MILKKVICACVVAMTMLSCNVLAFADDSAEIVEFKADSDFVVEDTGAPTLSFDKSEWSNYIKLTEESSSVGLALNQDTETSYQGASLKITADNSTAVEGLQRYAGILRNSDGTLMYPGSDDSTADETTQHLFGIEMNAADFGLTCFDGCLVTFTYRFNQESATALMGKSVMAFSCSDTYETNGLPTQLTEDELLDNNVTQYREATVMCPPSAGFTKFVIEIPVEAVVSDTMFYIDNIKIQIPSKNDETRVVKNLDGYNENATAKATVEGLEITQKGNTVASADSSAEESSSAFNPAIIIVGVLAVVVVAAVAILIVKKKTKFY